MAMSDSDAYVSDFGYSSSSSKAELKAQRSETLIALQEGDYLLLVAVDNKPNYADNPGEVFLEVWYMPVQ